MATNNFARLLVNAKSMGRFEGFVAFMEVATVAIHNICVDSGIYGKWEREIISKIQSLRKEAGFEVVDRITVNYLTNDAEIKEAFESGKEIAKVVLADSVKEGDADGFKKEIDVNGAACTVILNKVGK